MQQTFSFWGIITYLLSFLGCSNYDTTNYTSPPEKIPFEEVKDYYEHQSSYKESLSFWEQEKKLHQSSYEYTLSHHSKEGHFFETATIIVKNGNVHQRSYKRFEQIKDGTLKEMESWTESSDKLNTHEEGIPAKTLDSIYEECNSTYLKNRNVSDLVYFDVLNQGFISICGYIPNDCTGDCFRGFSIEAFKWLK